MKALNAYEMLKEEGIHITVINNPFINRPDTETVSNYVNEASGRLVTVEDHQIIGGMGSLLIHALSNSGHSFKSKSLGIQGEFGQSAYKADQLYAKNNMDEAAIIKSVKELMG